MAMTWPLGPPMVKLYSIALAGKFTGVFVEFRGDWEWSAETFGWRPGTWGIECMHGVTMAMSCYSSGLGTS